MDIKEFVDKILPIVIQGAFIFIVWIVGDRLIREATVKLIFTVVISVVVLIWLLKVLGVY